MKPSTPSTRRLRPSTIKKAIRAGGFRSLADFASHIGKSQAAVSYVIAGEMRSAYIAARIAALVGQPAHRIWPGHYMNMEVSA